ncbi:MAG TPA: phage holin family protein [Clostridiaceae bacterium]
MGNVNFCLLTVGVLGVFAFICDIFTDFQTSSIILLMLIILDTFTGISTAIKYKRFSSTGLRKLLKKITTYALSIITIRLLEIILDPIIITTLLSQIIVAFLAITECISILENLTLLGVPLPSNILPFLIKPLKIQVLNNMLENFKDKDKEFSDIEYIIKCQINNLDNPYLKDFLEIRYNAYKSIIKQIMLIDDACINLDILFLKVVSFVDLTLENTNKIYKVKNFENKYIERFSKNNKSTKEKFIEKLKIICYSDKTTAEKKDKLIDDIILVIYQSIIDARENI